MTSTSNTNQVRGTVDVLAPPSSVQLVEKPSQAAPSSAFAHRLRAAVHLLAVLCTAPLLLAHVLRQYLRRRASSSSRAVEGTAETALGFRRRTVLVTGGKMAKSLNIARALWRAGHRVVLVETDKYWCSGSRLSRAVWAFATVADPRDGKEGGAAYLRDLQRVFDEYGCDTFLPVSSPFSAHFDAMFLRGKQAEAKVLSDDKDEDDKSVTSLSSTDEDSTPPGSADEDSAAGEKNESSCGVDTMLSPVTRNTEPRSMHFTSRVCDILDDKHAFWQYCTETLGLPSSDAQDGAGAMLPSHHLGSDAQVLALNARLQAAEAEGSTDQYVLKNLGYDPLHRLDLFCLPKEEKVVVRYLDKIRADGNGISEDEPWQSQLFIPRGTETSCFAVLRDSRLALYTCCLSSASQLRYVHAGTTTEEEAETAKRNVGHTARIDAQAAACREWVDAFCAALRARGERWNGQLCWDFMCTEEGAVRAFPLECNPRVHSQCAVFGAANGDQRRFGEVLVGAAEEEDVLVPGMTTDGEAETHFWGWWANEFFSQQDTSYLLRCLEALHATLSGICYLLGLAQERGAPVFRYAKASDDNATWYTSHFAFKDSDLDVEDPLPFLGRNLLQPLVLFWGVLVSGNEWTKYDFCIGKVVEKNGD